MSEWTDLLSKSYKGIEMSCHESGKQKLEIKRNDIP